MEIKDYLHLYIGQDVTICEYEGAPFTCKLTGLVTERTDHESMIRIQCFIPDEQEPHDGHIAWYDLDELVDIHLRKLSDMKLKYGEALTYLNIPVVRNKDHDIVDFEGNPTPRHEIDRILRTRKRNEYFQSIINNPSVTHCYIRKGGSYYRPNSCGYTEFITRAGVYEKEEAVKHGVSCGDLGIEPINNDEHNQRLQKEIDEMKSRLIL